ncbi:T9SS type B sorting domain-containing protein [Polaribacter dokdonensis]|uniref:Gliding motility-associated C-terminal domain-containing protein n=1 Tax=Polaribacter dokdonensis DSW-5 TaxID=1300348 RepID=A0A0N0CGE3_9FLAO|nr:T9SS type B sorting domain-containing protein [Polaribacter dokdonensis]KOY53208.1 Gliding motility-associated C-terminal domain-containing protein [Polaribacter dokdonensis DSW-5]SEE58607.1 gliding motility-associated C-terminal domain-containing protein [Polaribacter dokdonensis DSW-5]
MKKLLSFLVFLMCATSAFSQLSKKHFIPPLTSTDGFTDQYIYISTPKTNNVSYKITPVGNSDLAQYSGIVSNGSPVVQAVLDENGNEDFDDNTQLHINRFNINSVINNKGFIIEANDVIYVSIRVRSALSGGDKFHAGALVSKGSSALGNEFRIGGLVRGSTPVDGHITFASLMATEDNTIVNITNIPSGFVQPNGSSIPSDIILNEGESFILASRTNAGFESKDIIGGLISSDKPIVVNSGSATGSFGNNNGRDYGFDQIVGADRIGSEYILVRGAGNNDWENALVIAHEDNTEISVNGGSIANLSAGEFVVIEGNSYNTNGNMYINSSLPVFVYQGIGGQSGSEANQGLFFVPPLSCENKGNVDNIAGIDKIGTADFPGGVTIVTNKGANVLINGLDISTYSPQGPSDVTGNPNYVTYKVSGLSRNIKVEGDQELYCAYFNANGFAASGAFYSGFPSAPEISFDTTVATLGSCIPNVTLQAANTDLFDSFEWQFFNETTSTWEQRSTTADYKPIESEPGKYRLIGTINCTGATFNSVEIPVSICPDDFDNDLIIDNVDVDLDNDGILNIDESLGDGIVNFTNLTNPSIDASGTPISNFLTGNLTSDGDVNFIGNTNGIFTSTINDNSSANASNIYELESTESFNFEFTQDANQPHTAIEGVEYEIGIGPAAKNVTLIDPDNILLVDTNFDGQFEADVDNYSSSLIRFRYNPSPNGNTPFKFVANDVDKVLFLHTATSNVTNSIFNGNLKLTNIRIDSDGDGIEDALDLDSDNDGVPDLFEAANQSITLLNTDNNLDGLDDVFNTATLVTDTDGDGVPNHLDLDSDNDGIYDLVESGFTVTDANNDGIIDNANAANVGINGLLDTLESTADSGVLATPLRNSDATSIVTANKDAIFDFADLESDGDGCFDVIEAGFTGNGSGILFANPFAVDSNGLVINNTDGYTAPNADYTISAPIVINSFVDPVFCELDTDIMTIDSNADGFQWQVSTDGTTWTSLVDDATYNGVTTQDLQITNTPLTFNNNQYRVLLSRTGNTCTEEASSTVTLSVNPLPIIKNNPSEINQCIDASDTNPTVNLTTAEDNISETAGITFEYFTDINGTNQITDPTSYPVSVNTVEVVYVSVISDQGCSNGLVELRVNVGQTPDNPYNDIQPPVCDDLLDADGNDTPGSNDDTDFITNFSLDRDAIINSINPPANTEVFFFENSTDRNNSLNEIDITAYRNDINKIDITTIPEGIQFPIYYKIISTINNDCQGLGEFFLQVHAVPQATTVADIEECDDALSGNTADGRNAAINLRDKVDEILGTGQTEADYSVTFHTTENGSMNNTDVITNDTNYTNEVQSGFTAGTTNEQTIYVRVQNRTGSMCYNANTSFKIIIQPIPTVPANVPDLMVCDVVTPFDADPRNRIAQNIDLTERESDILDNRTGLVVEYYISQTDAENRTNSISDPSNFQNTTAETSFPADFNSDDPGIQTIFFIIVDETGLQCPSVFSTFQLLVYPEPSINPVGVLSECDNDDDGDDANGIIQTIDLDSKIPEVLGASRNVSDFNVTFHSSQAEATSGANPLASPYTNSSSTETIYIRVQNKQTMCVNDDASFELIVNPLPNFTVTTPQILCLNDIPHNIGVENPADNYTYVWTDENGTVLNTTSVDNIDISEGGRYKVTATTTDGTMCSREETIEVNESNIATLESSFVTIVDESNNLGSTNNLSISIDIINNDLGPGDYQFAVVNTDDNTRIPFIGFQDEPLFENLEGGIYQIIVNDKNGCSPDTTLLVSVIQFPKFFTPNGDNNNDTWVVKGANQTFYPNASINIFNRFGNLVAQVPIDGNGWDGTYNGKLLPSDDYWYNVTLVPADTTKPTINKKGNFSLLRK